MRDDEDKKLYKNMSVLVDRVILKIESLFETQCEDCNEKYTNSLEDDSPFTCKLCMQGSHNCQILLDRKKFYEDAHENAPLGCVSMDLLWVPREKQPLDALTRPDS